MANAVATLSTFPSIAVSAGRPAPRHGPDQGRAQGPDHGHGHGRAMRDRPVPALIVFGKDEADRPHASVFGEADAGPARKAAALMGMHAVPVEADAVKALAARLPEGRVFASGKAFVPFVKTSLFDELLPHLAKDGKQTAAARLSGAGRSAAKAGSGIAGVAGVAGVVGDGADMDGSLQVNAVADADSGTGTGTDTSKSKEASAGGAGGAAGHDDAGSAASKRPTDWSRIGKGSEVLAYEKPGGEWYEAIVVEERTGDLIALRWRDFEGYPVFVRRRDHLGLLHPNFKAA